MRGIRHILNLYRFLMLFDFPLVAHMLGQWITLELASESEIRYGAYQFYYHDRVYHRTNLYQRH